MSIQNANTIIQGQEKVSLGMFPGTAILASLKKLGLMLAGRSHPLFDLTTVHTTCTIEDYYYVGLQSVSLGQIRGSASTSRCYAPPFKEQAARVLGQLHKERQEWSCFI